MSSRHPCILLILFHTIITWYVYANAIIEHDRKENKTKSLEEGSTCRNVYQYFGDSSCQANIKQYIIDAINTVLTRQDRSDEKLDEKIRALSAKIETLERMIDDKLDRCTLCFGNTTCPSGYVYYEQDKSCIKFHEECKSWSEARKVCQQEGGDLVSLKAETFDFFRNVSRSKAGNCYNVWIGVTDIASEGQWYWLNGERVTSIFWATDEPNNNGGSEHCGGLSVYHNYYINDNVCSSNAHFICQIV